VAGRSEAVTGPRWMRDAYVGATCTDAKGEVWRVMRVSVGGRVIDWASDKDRRPARTEATPTHPEYPTDAEVLEAQRAERREEKSRYRR